MNVIYNVKYTIVFELKGEVEIMHKIKAYDNLKDAYEFVTNYNTFGIKHRELIHYEILVCPLGLTSEKGAMWLKEQQKKGNLLK